MVLELCCGLIYAVDVIGFSTLYGSNGVGTGGFNNIINNLSKFQYPLRVEWCWNAWALYIRTPLLPVSVPSTGRMVLEHADRVVAVGESACFSTLYGSNGVGTLPAYH